jgi:hypothetical protein
MLSLRRRSPLVLLVVAFLRHKSIFRSMVGQKSLVCHRFRHERRWGVWCGKCRSTGFKESNHLVDTLQIVNGNNIRAFPIPCHKPKLRYEYRHSKPSSPVDSLDRAANAMARSSEEHMLQCSCLLIVSIQFVNFFIPMIQRIFH